MENAKSDNENRVAVIGAFKFAGLFELVFEGEDVEWRPAEADASDGAENNLVFGAVEVVGLKDGNELGNNFAVFQHQSEQIFFYFDGVWQF